MTDAVTPNEDKSEENKSQLAKIEPVKKTDLHEVRDSDNSDVEILPSSVAKIELGKSLILLDLYLGSLVLETLRQYVMP